MPLNPWWIITLLPDAGDFSRASVGDLLDDHLVRWSRINEVIASENAPRWWAIDHWSPSIPASEEVLVQQINTFLYHPLQRRDGEAPRIGGNINANQLHIAIVGDARCQLTQTYLHCLARMLRLRQSTVFAGMSLRLIAFIYLPQDACLTADGEAKSRIAKFLTELHTMMAEVSVFARPFELIFLLQDRNNTADNPAGYTALAERQVAELLVQSLFHLMVGESDTLGKLAHAHQTQYFSLGATAIYYDAKRRQRELARQLGRDLLDQFASSQEPPFVSREQAERAVAGLQREVEVRRLFSRLTLGAGRPSFSFSARVWEQATDADGRPLSPWALHRTALLDVYFHVYLRRLPWRLAEYARLFLTSSMQRFREFLKARHQRVWEGDPERAERGLKEIILEIASNILKGEFGQARSITQVKKTLEQIRKVCDPARVTSSLVSLDEFQRLKVFDVPDYLEDFYNEASDHLGEDQEAQLYDRVVNTIRSHPIPLALFLRASLLAILAAFLGSWALGVLSPEVINIEWLLRVPGLAPVVLGLIPMGAAFWRYQVRTLNELDKRIKMYVAAMLRHAQTRARDLVRSEIASLLQDAVEFCDEIERYLDELKEKFAYPDSEETSYASTTFQRSLLETIEIPGRGQGLMILPKAPQYTIDISGQKKSYDQCDRAEKNSLLNTALDQQSLPALTLGLLTRDAVSVARPSGSAFLWELLCDKIPTAVSEASVKTAGKLLRAFAEEIYKNVGEDTLDRLWLGSTAKGHVSGIANAMKSLCFPPVLFSEGVVPLPEVAYEWKYADREALQSLIESDAFSHTRGRSLLSLSACRPITQLGNIGAVRALFSSVDLSQMSWNEAASIFTLATSGPEQGERFVLKSADDGHAVPIAASEETRRRVEKLRTDLGVQCREEDVEHEI